MWNLCSSPPHFVPFERKETVVRSETRLDLWWFVLSSFSLDENLKPRVHLGGRVEELFRLFCGCLIAAALRENKFVHTDQTDVDLFLAAGNQHQQCVLFTETSLGFCFLMLTRVSVFPTLEVEPLQMETLSKWTNGKLLFLCNRNRTE